MGYLETLPADLKCFLTYQKIVEKWRSIFLLGDLDTGYLLQMKLILSVIMLNINVVLLMSVNGKEDVLLLVLVLMVIILKIVMVLMIIVME